MLTKTKKRYLFSAIVFLFLLLSTSAGFFLLKNSQDNRQQASGCSSGEPYCTCAYNGSGMECKLDPTLAPPPPVPPPGSTSLSPSPIVKTSATPIPTTTIVPPSGSGIVSTTYKGPRATSKGGCGGVWMSSFCYMPGDVLAGDKVVVASGRYSYPYIENKTYYESANFNTKGVSEVVGSTASLGQECGGRGVAVGSTCYAYGATVNGYLIVPPRTSGCNNSTGDYCYAHLEKIEVKGGYAAWQAAVDAYKGGDLSALEKLYKDTYGVAFSSGSLYDPKAANADLLKAQALLSALTNAETLREQAAAQNRQLSQGGLTAAEKLVYDANEKIINGSNGEAVTLDSFVDSTLKNISLNSASNKTYTSLVNAIGDADLNKLAVEQFKAIYGYDPGDKFKNLNSLLNAIGIDPTKLNSDRAQAAIPAAAANGANQNDPKIEKLNEEYKKYAVGSSEDIAGLRQAMIAAGLTSIREADGLSNQALLEIFLSAATGESAEQVKETASGLIDARNNAQKESELIGDYLENLERVGQDKGERDDIADLSLSYLTSIYELQNDGKVPPDSTGKDWLQKEISKENAQFALSLYAVTQDAGYLQNYYKNNFGSGSSPDDRVPTNEKVLLTAIYGEETANEVYRSTVLPTRFQDAIASFSLDGGDSLRRVCNEVGLASCNINSDNAINALDEITTALYAGKVDSEGQPFNIPQMTTDFANKINLTSKETEKESFMDLLANAFVAGSYSNLSARTGGDYSNESVSAYSEYEKSQDQYQIAIDATKIFDEFQTYSYAKENQDQIDDYTFGLAYGNALMNDNIFTDKNFSTGDTGNNALGLSTGQSIGLGYNQVISQLPMGLNVTNTVTDIASTYATAQRDDYTGPANTYVSNLAMIGAENLDLVDSYQAADLDFYVDKSLSNAATDIGSAVTYVSTYRNTILEDVFSGNLTFSNNDPAEAAAQASAVYEANHEEKTLKAVYDEHVANSGTNGNSTDFASFEDFMTDPEIQRSAEALHYETLANVVAPTVAIVTLPIAMWTGAATPVLLGLASSEFSLYQGAGMKAQALELQRYDIETKKNALILSYEESGMSDIEIEAEKAKLQMQIDTLNSQGNMMLANSAVAAVTSAGGWVSGLAQAAGNTTGALMTTGQILTKAGQAGGIGLNSYNSYAAGREAASLYSSGDIAGGNWSAITSFIAATGTLGNSFGLVGGNKITNVIDLFGDASSGVAGTVVDMRQVTAACGNASGAFDDKSCANAVIGLALSAGQNVSQVAASTKTYNQDVATAKLADLQKQVGEVEAEIFKLDGSVGDSRQVLTINILKTHLDSLNGQLATLTESNAHLANVSLPDNFKTANEAAANGLKAQIDGIKADGQEAETKAAAEIATIKSSGVETESEANRINDLEQSEIARKSAEAEQIARLTSQLDVFTKQPQEVLDLNTKIKDIDSEITKKGLSMSAEDYQAKQQERAALVKDLEGRVKDLTVVDSVKKQAEALVVEAEKSQAKIESDRAKLSAADLKAQDQIKQYTPDAELAKYRVEREAELAAAKLESDPAKRMLSVAALEADMADIARLETERQAASKALDGYNAEQANRKIENLTENIKQLEAQPTRNEIEITSLKQQKDNAQANLDKLIAIEAEISNSKARVQASLPENKPFWSKIIDAINPFGRTTRQAYENSLSLIAKQNELQASYDKVSDDPNSVYAKQLKTELEAVQRQLLEQRTVLATAAAPKKGTIATLMDRWFPSSAVKEERAAVADLKNLAEKLGEENLKLAEQIKTKMAEITAKLAEIEELKKAATVDDALIKAKEAEIAELNKVRNDLLDTANSSMRGSEALIQINRGGKNDFTKYEVTPKGDKLGLKNDQLRVLNDELKAFEEFRRASQTPEQLASNPFKIYSETGSFKDQDVFLLAEIEAFGAGRRGTVFGALPGMGKTDLVMPFNVLLKQRLTNDSQFVVFPEAKLMKPWTTDDNYTANGTFMRYVEERFGEGSVIIIRPNDTAVDPAALAKAKFVITTKDVAFDLQSTGTQLGAILRNKWRSSYVHADEVDWTFNPNENYKLSGAQVALKSKEEYQLYLNAQLRMLGIDENGSSVPGGLPALRKLIYEVMMNKAIPKGIVSTVDGNGGKFADTTDGQDLERQVLNEWLASWGGQGKIPGLDMSGDIVDVRKKINLYLAASTGDEIHPLRAELAMINETVNLLSKVPNENYGLTSKDGINSIAPNEQNRVTGRSYSAVAESLIYNTLGARILGVGLGEIDLGKITVGEGGSEINYALLMLESKGFSLYTGTPETVAKFYKMAYGIELKAFSASAIDDTMKRFAESDSKIFAAIMDQIADRISENKNQVYVNMAAGLESNDVAFEKLVRSFRSIDGAETYQKFVRIGANGELAVYELRGSDLVPIREFATTDELNAYTLKLDEANSKLGERYVKFYDYGAHIGVDTANNVAFSRAVGICNGCDETTFAQGINRIRVQVGEIDPATGKAKVSYAPIDIVWLDSPAGRTPDVGDFQLSIKGQQAINEAIAEVSFKETLLKNSVDATFTDLIDLAKNGKEGGFLGLGSYKASDDLVAKLEAARQKWKETSGMNYTLGADDLTAQAKLDKTAGQVAGVYAELTKLLTGSGEPAKLLAERADGAVGDDTIKLVFSGDDNYTPLGEKPSYRQIVDLINKSSEHLGLVNIAFTNRTSPAEVIQREIANAVNQGQNKPAADPNAGTGGSGTVGGIDPNTGPIVGGPVAPVGGNGGGNNTGAAPNTGSAPVGNSGSTTNTSANNTRTTNAGNQAAALRGTSGAARSAFSNALSNLWNGIVDEDKLLEEHQKETEDKKAELLIAYKTEADALKVERDAGVSPIRAEEITNRLLEIDVSDDDSYVQKEAEQLVVQEFADNYRGEGIKSGVQVSLTTLLENSERTGFFKTPKPQNTAPAAATQTEEEIFIAAHELEIDSKATELRTAALEEKRTQITDVSDKVTVLGQELTKLLRTNIRSRSASDKQRITEIESQLKVYQQELEKLGPEQEALAIKDFSAEAVNAIRDQQAKQQQKSSPLATVWQFVKDNWKSRNSKSKNKTPLLSWNVFSQRVNEFIASSERTGTFKQDKPKTPAIVPAINTIATTQNPIAEQNLLEEQSDKFTKLREVVMDGIGEDLGEIRDEETFTRELERISKEITDSIGTFADWSEEDLIHLSGTLAELEELRGADTTSVAVVAPVNTQQEKFNKLTELFKVFGVVSPQIEDSNYQEQLAVFTKLLKEIKDLQDRSGLIYITYNPGSTDLFAANIQRANVDQFRTIGNFRMRAEQAAKANQRILAEDRLTALALGATAVEAAAWSIDSEESLDRIEEWIESRQKAGNKQVPPTNLEIAQKQANILEVPDNAVFLHRTVQGNQQSIFQNGLAIGASWNTTMTRSSIDSFIDTHAEDDTVIVVNMPKGLDEGTILDSWLDENFEKQSGSLVIPARYIRGSISRVTGEFTPNPLFREITKEENDLAENYTPLPTFFDTGDNTQIVDESAQSEEFVADKFDPVAMLFDNPIAEDAASTENNSQSPIHIAAIQSGRISNLVPLTSVLVLSTQLGNLNQALALLGEQAPFVDFGVVESVTRLKAFAENFEQRNAELESAQAELTNILGELKIDPQTVAFAENVSDLQVQIKAYRDKQTRLAKLRDNLRAALEAHSELTGEDLSIDYNEEVSETKLASEKTRVEGLIQEQQARFKKLTLLLKSLNLPSQDIGSLDTYQKQLNQLAQFLTDLEQQSFENNDSLADSQITTQLAQIDEIRQFFQDIELTELGDVDQMARIEKLIADLHDARLRISALAETVSNANALIDKINQPGVIGSMTLVAMTRNIRDLELAISSTLSLIGENFNLSSSLGELAKELRAKREQLRGLIAEVRSLNQEYTAFANGSYQNFNLNVTETALLKQKAELQSLIDVAKLAQAEAEDANSNEISKKAEQIIQDLTNKIGKSSPETQASYEESLASVLPILTKEPGILQLANDVPVLVISDQHANANLLINSLKQTVKTSQGEMPASEAMSRGLLQIVCLGDGMHSENRENWTKKNGESIDQDGPEMATEMARALNLMKAIMDLKTAYPDSFHYLRGNHDRMYASLMKHGVSQSMFYLLWLEKNFGDGFLEKWQAFESSLPLMAVQKNSDGLSRVFTHAAPNSKFIVEGDTYQDLSLEDVNKKTDKAYRLLTWTDNTSTARYPYKASEETISAEINRLLAALGLDPQKNVWVIGHRDVDSGEFYRAQLGNRLIQINDKNRQLVALLDPAADSVAVMDVNSKTNKDKKIANVMPTVSKKNNESSETQLAIKAMSQPLNDQRDSERIKKIIDSASKQGWQVEVDGYISEGGFGVVYLVRVLNTANRSIPEYMAVKVQKESNDSEIASVGNEDKMASKLREIEGKGEFAILSPNLYTVHPFAVDEKNGVIFEELLIQKPDSLLTSQDNVLRAYQYGHREYLLRQNGLYEQDKLNDSVYTIDNQLKFVDPGSYGQTPKYPLAINAEFLKQVVTAFYPKEAELIGKILSGLQSNSVDSSRNVSLLKSKQFSSLPKVIQYQTLVLIGLIPSISSDEAASTANYRELLLDMLAVAAANNTEEVSLPTELREVYGQVKNANRISRLDDQNILALAGINTNSTTNAADQILISNIIDSPQMPTEFTLNSNQLIYTDELSINSRPYNRVFPEDLNEISYLDRAKYILNLDLSKHQLSKEAYIVLRLAQYCAQYVDYILQVKDQYTFEQLKELNDVGKETIRLIISRAYSLVNNVKFDQSEMAENNQNYIDENLLPLLTEYHDAFVRILLAGDSSGVDFSITPDSLKNDIDLFSTKDIDNLLLTIEMDLSDGAMADSKMTADLTDSYVDQVEATSQALEKLKNADAEIVSSLKERIADIEQGLREKSSRLFALEGRRDSLAAEYSSLANIDLSFETVNEFGLLKQIEEVKRLVAEEKTKKSQRPRATFEQAKQIVSNLANTSDAKVPENQVVYENSLKNVTQILQKESGIVELAKDKPIVTISDMHARGDFLINALSQKIKTTQGEMTVLEAMSKDLVVVICNGDGMHSEVASNWTNPDADADGGEKSIEANDQKMFAEMARSLNLMKTVMDLKINFPNSFHYVKGNHDGMGIINFSKYASESDLVKQWMDDNFGQSFTQKWLNFEDSLPLMAVQRNTDGSARVFTHAAPNPNTFSMKTDPDKFIETIKAKSSDAFWLLTLTDVINAEYKGQDARFKADEASVSQLTEILLSGLGLDPKKTIWVIGHRDVDDEDRSATFRAALNNRLIQINSKTKQLIAILNPAQNQAIVNDVNPSTQQGKQAIVLSGAVVGVSYQSAAKTQPLFQSNKPVQQPNSRPSSSGSEAIAKKAKGIASVRNKTYVAKAADFEGLANAIVFGRKSDNTLVISDLGLSRNHVSIFHQKASNLLFKTPDVWAIRDLGSTNGIKSKSFSPDKLTAKKNYMLQAGDIFTLSVGTSIEIIQADQDQIQFQIIDTPADQTCSDCDAVHTQTQIGADKADALWSESQSLSKQAAAAKTSGDQYQFNYLTKQAADKKTAALQQLSKTRDEVISDHGFENQCVQRWLYALVDSREALIRNTLADTNSAIQAVRFATESVLKTLADNFMTGQKTDLFGNISSTGTTPLTDKDRADLEKMKTDLKSLADFGDDHTKLEVEPKTGQLKDLRDQQLKAGSQENLTDVIRTQARDAYKFFRASLLTDSAASGLQMNDFLDFMKPLLASIEIDGAVGMMPLAELNLNINKMEELIDSLTGLSANIAQADGVFRKVVALSGTLQRRSDHVFALKNKAEELAVEYSDKTSTPYLLGDLARVNPSSLIMKIDRLERLLAGESAPTTNSLPEIKAAVSKKKFEPFKALGKSFNGLSASGKTAAAGAATAATFAWLGLGRLAKGIGSRVAKIKLKKFNPRSIKVPKFKAIKLPKVPKIPKPNLSNLRANATKIGNYLNKLRKAAFSRKGIYAVVAGITIGVLVWNAVFTPSSPPVVPPQTGPRVVETAGVPATPEETEVAPVAVQPAVEPAVVPQAAVSERKITHYFQGHPLYNLIDDAIEQSGCWLTTTAMILSSYTDQHLDPAQLREKYFNGPIYDNGAHFSEVVDELKENGVTAVDISHNKQIVRDRDPSNYIAQNINSNKSYVVAIYCDNCYEKGHWLWVVDVNDKGEMLALDPYRDEDRLIALNETNYPGLHYLSNPGPDGGIDVFEITPSNVIEQDAEVVVEKPVSPPVQVQNPVESTEDGSNLSPQSSLNANTLQGIAISNPGNHGIYIQEVGADSDTAITYKSDQLIHSASTIRIVVAAGVLNWADRYAKDGNVEKILNDYSPAGSNKNLAQLMEDMIQRDDQEAIAALTRFIEEQTGQPFKELFAKWNTKDINLETRYMSAQSMGKILNGLVGGTLVSDASSKYFMDLLAADASGEDYAWTMVNLDNGANADVEVLHKIGFIPQKGYWVKNDVGVIKINGKQYIVVVFGQHETDKLAEDDVITQVASALVNGAGSSVIPLDSPVSNPPISFSENTQSIQYAPGKDGLPITDDDMTYFDAAFARSAAFAQYFKHDGSLRLTKRSPGTIPKSKKYYALAGHQLNGKDYLASIDFTNDFKTGGHLRDLLLSLGLTEREQAEASLAHEIGHNLQFEKDAQGNLVESKLYTDFANLFSRGGPFSEEKAPTNYAEDWEGEDEISEDFSDTYALFLYAPEYLKQVGPYHYKFWKSVADGVQLQEIVDMAEYANQSEETAASDIVNSADTVYGSALQPKFSAKDSVNPYENIPSWVYEQVLPNLDLKCGSAAECQQKMDNLPLANPTGFELTVNSDYKPADLVQVSSADFPIFATIYIRDGAVDSIKGFIQELEDNGIKVGVHDGYRSYEDQQEAFYDNPEGAAAPGQSTHQFGVSIDIYRRNNDGSLNTERSAPLNDQILEIAHKHGLVHPAEGDVPHWLALDVIQPGLTQVLIDNGINPDDKENLIQIFLGMAQAYEKQAADLQSPAGLPALLLPTFGGTIFTQLNMIGSVAPILIDNTFIRNISTWLNNFNLLPKYINQFFGNLVSSSSNFNKNNAVYMFSSLCSDCEDIRLATATNVKIADDLMIEANEFEKRAVAAKAANDQNLATQLTKQATAKKASALEQLNATRNQVVNEHGSQNQCVKLYLNAWVNTREALIRQTKADVNNAIDSVYTATALALQLQSSGKMTFKEGGLWGFFTTDKTIDLTPVDLQNIKDLLEGNSTKKIEGLNSFATFAKVPGKNDQITRTIISGSLLKLSNTVVSDSINPLRVFSRMTYQKVKNRLFFRQAQPASVKFEWKFAKPSIKISWSVIGGFIANGWNATSARAKSLLAKKISPSIKPVAGTISIAPTISVVSSPSPTISMTITPSPSPKIIFGKEKNDYLGNTWRALLGLLRNFWTKLMGGIVVTDLSFRGSEFIIFNLKIFNYKSALPHYDVNSDKLKLLAEKGVYTDYVCEGGSSYSKDLTKNSNNLTKISDCANGCYKGACLATVGGSCNNDSNIIYASEDNKCLLACKSGSFVKSGSCEHVKVGAYSNKAYWEVYKSLNSIPDDILDKENVYFYASWKPDLVTTDKPEYITMGFAVAHAITMKPVVIAGGWSNDPDTIIHEYFHIYGGQEHRLYPDWAPFSTLVSFAENFFNVTLNSVTNATPENYVKLLEYKTNFLANIFTFDDKFIYGKDKYPVISYSNLKPDQINIDEDFADSAAGYVTMACELKSKSEIRYNYFKDDVFGGQEYLPAGGCE